MQEKLKIGTGKGPKKIQAKQVSCLTIGSRGVSRRGCRSATGGGRRGLGGGCRLGSAEVATSPMHPPATTARSSCTPSSRLGVGHGTSAWIASCLDLNCGYVWHLQEKLRKLALVSNTNAPYLKLEPFHHFILFTVIKIFFTIFFNSTKNTHF